MNQMVAQLSTGILDNIAPIVGALVLANIGVVYAVLKNVFSIGLTAGEYKARLLKLESDINQAHQFIREIKKG